MYNNDRYHGREERDDTEERTLKVDKISVSTDKAIGVNGDDDKLVWFPKSQITLAQKTGHVLITMPRWLADQKHNLTFEE